MHPLDFRSGSAPDPVLAENLCGESVTRVIGWWVRQVPGTMTSVMAMIVLLADSTCRLIRAEHDGIDWETLPVRKEDRGSFAQIISMQSPEDAAAMGLLDEWTMVNKSKCVRCGDDGSYDDVLPCEVRIGVKLKVDKALCSSCSNAMVAIVRSFLNMPPTADKGPRNIIL